MITILSGTCRLNVLIDQPAAETYIGKLCDFGFSAELPKVREDG